MSRREAARIIARIQNSPSSPASLENTRKPPKLQPARNAKLSPGVLPPKESESETNVTLSKPKPKPSTWSGRGQPCTNAPTKTGIEVANNPANEALGAHFPDCKRAVEACQPGTIDQPGD